MRMRFFDFEVTPNWWCCILGDLPEDFSNVTQSIKDTFVEIDSDMPNARDLLMQLMRDNNYVLSGYNIKGYDLSIANGVYQGFNEKQIKIINDLIIKPFDLPNWTNEHSRMQPFAKKKLYSINYQDLMDDSSGSLKQKEAILGLDIRESEVSFDKENLTEDDKLDLKKYCKHDVYAAMMFYIKVVHPYTLTKLNMGNHFKIPEQVCRKNTNPSLVGIALGAKRTQYSDAEREDIVLPSKIREYCYDNTPKAIIEHICNSKKPLQLSMFNNKFAYGNGGIHSALNPNVSDKDGIYLESDDDWVLLNIDAESYYPSMMIQFNTISRSIKNPQVFVDIYNERMEIKHKPEKTHEEDLAQMADKLVLNSTFGASGCKWLDLYDPYQCTSTCRIGQVLLTALVCKLKNNIQDLEIVQTNTDGILIYVKRKYVHIVDKLMEEWTKTSGINMEKDVVSKIWQKNVNNYMLVKDNGKIKTRGLWLNCDIVNPGYVTLSPLAAFICQKAAINYLLKNEDVISTIVKCKDLTDFSIVCTKGPTFKGVYQNYADGTEKHLFNCNRVIATKDEYYGKLYKYGYRKGKLFTSVMPNTPEHCFLVNEDLSTYNFDDIKKHLDYMYYIERSINVLDVDWYGVANGKFLLNNKFDYMK